MLNDLLQRTASLNTQKYILFILMDLPLRNNSFVANNTGENVRFMARERRVIVYILELAVT